MAETLNGYKSFFLMVLSGEKQKYFLNQVGTECASLCLIARNHPPQEGFEAVLIGIAAQQSVSTDATLDVMAK